jgi:RecB family exonuclease
VRALHGELGAEGLDFRAVLGDSEVARRPPERRRWQALERAHAIYRTLLDAQGLLDPHDARRAAIAAGRIDSTRDVVLVGCLELSGLQRSLLEQLEGRVTALVPAPADEAQAFDALGAVQVDHWFERDLPIDLDHWRVVGDPGDQTEAVVEWLASLEGSRAANEVTVGLLDDEVRASLERRLAELGLHARPAEGVPLSKCAPARLLSAVGGYVEQRSWSDFAAMVRLPEVEAVLERECAAQTGSPAAVLDAYHGEHLPVRVRGRWCIDGDAPRGIGRSVRGIHAALEALLADLAGPPQRALPDWIPALRSLLERVYGRADLDAIGRSGRSLREELAQLAAPLAQLEAVPRALAPEVGPGDALAVLSDELAAVRVPPGAGDETTIELLGWLELPFDDAPALAVTGLAEGRVPASPAGDAFLPDRLRARLGLVDDRRRLARDACILHWLLHSRADLLLVNARRDAARNPLLPSRLLLRAEPGQVVRRVRHAFGSAESPESTGRGDGTRFELSRVEASSFERIAVTSFRTFLESPYRYYVERHLRADARDDAAQEMDGRLFGSLLHTVLAAFHGSEWASCQSAAAIEEFLQRRLEEQVRDRFGEDLLPAVRMQVLQARQRFSLFARSQARHAASGWRIDRTEWAPDGGTVSFDVDGDPIEISGRIDRIDRHRDGRWAILDYKTGNSMPSKTSVRKVRNGKWLDLQLPLYGLLAAGLDDGLRRREEVVYGYACLGKDASNTGFLTFEWSRDELDEADRTARDVVRAIRSGRVFEVGSWRPTDPVAAALVGAGILGADEDSEPLAAALGRDEPAAGGAS